MVTPSKGAGLSLFPLTALVVGSIIGSGMFNLPQNMAENSGGLAIIIAWVITAIGMLCLTRLYQNLSLRKPELYGGPYVYAREGFGDFVGFAVAWGRWIASMSGNAGYLVMLMAAFGGFSVFSFIGNGENLAGTIGALIALWVTHLLCFMGVRTAAFVNTFITLAKMIPILFFIAVAIALFNSDIFAQSYWGPGGLEELVRNLQKNLVGEGSLGIILSSPEAREILFAQIKDGMLYTAWVFVGVESASLYSARAKDMKTVARATVLGFVITMVMYMCVSLLSLGLIPQAELANMDNPSMRIIMATVLGPEAAMVINLGVIISIAGAFLAWTMLAAESLYITALQDDDTGPRFFGKTNSKGAPTVALWWTNIVVSIMLIMSLIWGKGYNELILLATSMYLIPYFLNAIYGMGVAASPDAKGRRDIKFLITCLLATLYGMWLIFAGGLDFLLVSMLLYAPCIVLFLYRRYADKKPLVKNSEELVTILGLFFLALISLYMLAAGHISL
ncbi:MAG: amino acid permease [Desulfovibrionaceae bacterium]|nr:amino acid permease [Desulfovibrionaceae bacterium]